MARKLPSSLQVGNSPPIPLSSVELHVHLDGALRYETIWELLKDKKLPLPGRGTLADLKHAVQVQKPKDLMLFLSGFAHFAPAYVGDLAAIKRLSYEFCEDSAANGVAYAEARFSPHLMTDGKVPEATPTKIVEAVLEGFREGEKDFGIKARAILCCIRGRDPEEARDTLRLCEIFRDKGVVGIDVAGDEGACCKKDAIEGIHLDPTEISVFTEAKNLGIHRTVHAGEAGPAESVRQALTQLHAERIGHGYRVLEDASLYRQCLADKVHFETCPSSSIMTGAVPLDMVLHHPIVRFACDGANFSINSDDPTVTGTRVRDEYAMLRNWGLSEVHFVRANFNAQRSCFLPDFEKKQLRKQLLAVYGMDDE